MTGRWVLVLGALLTAALPAGAAHAACKVARFAELPVTMRGLRPIVTAQINGHPAPFLLDSGAGYSNMAPAVAAGLGLSRQDLPGFRVSGVGGSVSAGVTTVKRFTLAGQTIPNVQFVVGGSEVGATGLLGQNILGLADVEYDLPEGAVRLFKADGCSKLAMAYWTNGKPFFQIDIESLEMARHHTVGILELDGAKVHAVFDTGATSTVLSLRAAARAGVHPGDPGVERAGWDFGVGSKPVQGYVARFKLLRIGNEELHNVRLRMADLGDNFDMLLGADYFVSHRLYVSNAQRRIYFTYTGGRLFDTGAHVDADSTAVALSGGATGEPTDAEGFSRRGAMRQTQRDLPHAIEDYARAVQLAPTEPRYVLQRAYAYLVVRKPALAGEDIDTAIRLEPGNLPAHLLRAQVRLRAGDHAGSLADLDTVAAALPRTNTERLALGQLYSANDAFDRAIEQFGDWLDTHPGDAGRGAALNGRCWARALAGKDLPKARADCDAAVRTVPGNASYLDSRGVANLRLGDDDRAIADFSAALALAPRMAWSLYGRGLAERHKGMEAKATTDIAAAVTVAPDIAERAAHYGVK